MCPRKQSWLVTGYYTPDQILVAQNYQHLLKNDICASYSTLSREFKNSKIKLGQTGSSSWVIQTKFWLYDGYSYVAVQTKININ